jgi:hypothetical protein
MGCDQSHLGEVNADELTRNSHLGEYLRSTASTVTFYIGKLRENKQDHMLFHVQSRSVSKDAVANVLCNFLQTIGYYGHEVYKYVGDYYRVSHVDGGPVITSKQKWLDYKATLVAEGVIFRSEPCWAEIDDPC